MIRDSKSISKLKYENFPAEKVLNPTLSISDQTEYAGLSLLILWL